MLNKVILMGRLTRDPEARSNSAGLSISNFTLAVDRTFARQGEERQTDFIPIVAFRSQADFSLRYFKKGQLVAVVGRLQVRSWMIMRERKRYANRSNCRGAAFCRIEEKFRRWRLSRRRK